jgi:hypothetical protein
MSFRQSTVLLGVLTAVLSLLAHAFCLLPVLLWRSVIVWHVDSFRPLARTPATRGFSPSHFAAT